MDDGDERHALIRHTTRQFADAKIRPVAVELDRSERFPEDLYREMAAAGAVRHHRSRRNWAGPARTAPPTRS